MRFFNAPTPRRSVGHSPAPSVASLLAEPDNNVALDRGQGYHARSSGATFNLHLGSAEGPRVRSIEPYLHALVDVGGSDLHIKAGAVPRIRLDGVLRPLRAEPLEPEETSAMLSQIMRPDLADEFALTGEADFAYMIEGVGRFRVNAFRQRGHVGLVMRRVSVGAIPLAELGVPDPVYGLAMEPRGLILVTGPTGSGKTTTLAGMIDEINNHRDVHIVTIEDPIEVIHNDNRALINQREVRIDTADFRVAMRAAMRQDPDVILIGEMRDTETVHAALSAAETGHLVLSTLHTVDVQETVSRIIDFFPPHEQQQIRISLAGALRGVLCQRLVPRADGQGRCVAMEIGINTGRVADAIVDRAKTGSITQLVQQGSFYGMQSFDQHLVILYRDKVITLEAAMEASSSPHDLEVELRRLGLVASV